MNKSSTIEYLRGLKFMQRKEEMKRQELYQQRYRAELASSDPVCDNTHDKAVGDSHKRSGNEISKGNGLVQKRRKGPIIVREDPFPFASYSLSRQSFHVEEELSPEKISESESIEQQQLRKKRRIDYMQEGESTEDNTEEDPSAEEIEDLTVAPSLASARKEASQIKCVEGEKGITKKGSRGVFFPSENTRAPKLTKSLEARLRKAA